MYYPCSENKGADQLCGYHEADLRLCFSHMQFVGFLTRRLIYVGFYEELTNTNLAEAVLTSTHNLCFGLEIRKTAYPSITKVHSLCTCNCIPDGKLTFSYYQLSINTPLIKTSVNREYNERSTFNSTVLSKHFVVNES